MEQVLDGNGIERLEEYFGEVGQSDWAMSGASIIRDVRDGVVLARATAEASGRSQRGRVVTHRAPARATGYSMTDSQWSDRGVRQKAAEHALAAMTARDPVQAWIVDDTGMMKQGIHSVGVQRQYTGTVGKVANCQVAVSLSLATRTEHVTVDFEVYLPKSWTGDPARRRGGNGSR